ncbi:MAG TPA: alanine--glyoxylate aminotransferase family protein [Solirubrobacteraceae bacterium]|jgi:alanine-glyoxylate transaminase/serine-glyoxylate transaminase/serine-pyruvate transaminase|nr:alanine--glyoxylate aminotransferase family protein [Solirubrobacteraceae bacterium]
MRTTPFDPPARLLTGPGPSNPDPRVVAEMQRPMLGHLDPDLHELLLETVESLRRAWRAPDDALVLALSSTGTSAMEAGIVNLVAPGETIVVANAGFFGARIVQLARRHGANVVELKADHGHAVPNNLIVAALDRHPHARLVAVVHAETSTGVEHPLAQLGASLEQSGHRALLMADCVTSLAGVELDVSAAHLDYAYSCTQKCLGAPPGMAPIALSARARERLQSRTHEPPFSLDLAELERYWIERPASYHHTAPILNIYALHEALRLVHAEGLEQRWRRHRVAGAYLQQGVQALGLELLAEPHRQLAPLTAVLVPDGVDRAAVQRTLLREHGIEVGGGLGPDAPPIWRIGLMGHNATEETAELVLTAFEAVLDDVQAMAAA